VVPIVAEICLIANNQNQGPTYLSDTNNQLMDVATGTLLAGRMIVTSGMGNMKSPKYKLHGPIPVTELTIENTYLCYFYSLDPERSIISENPQVYTQIMLCLIIKEEFKNLINDKSMIIENILQDVKIHLGNDDHPFFSNDNVSTKDLSELLAKLNNCLDIAKKVNGVSIYEIGVVTSLPDNISKIAKKIILNPNGIPKKDIVDYESLEILYQIGLIRIDIREGIEWCYPN